MYFIRGSKNSPFFRRAQWSLTVFTISRHVFCVQNQMYPVRITQSYFKIHFHFISYLRSTLPRDIYPSIGRASQRSTFSYLPVRETEGYRMDNPERLLHHVTEVEPRHKVLLPGGPPSGVGCENTTQLALTGDLMLPLVLCQGR